jgi:nicotinamidase-related amidase
MTRLQIDAAPSPVAMTLEESALLVIDMQADFLLQGGFGAQLGNDVDHLRRTIAPIQQLLAAARRAGMLVIHTREGHPPDMHDCPPTKLARWPVGTRIGDVGPMGRILIQGEPGHALLAEVAPWADEVVLDKPGKNAFYATALDAILRRHGIRNVWITGVTTDVCCLATTIAANDHGFHALVLADCVASYSPARHAAALEIIQAQGGIFGWVSDAQRLLAAWQAADVNAA